MIENQDNNPVDYEIIESKQIFEILTIAKEYIEFISKIDKTDAIIIINYLHKLLPLLYLKCSLIPDVKVEDNSSDERYVVEEEYEILYQKIKEKFLVLKHNSFDINNVAETLTDLYQDLKDFTLLYTTNKYNSQVCSIYNIKQWFIHRFGLNIIELIKNFHKYIYKNENYIKQIY